jgi:hypothetical protein
MNKVSRDALKAVVEETGIYGTLTALANIMEELAGKELDKRRRVAALQVARSIRNARDAS